MESDLFPRTEAKLPPHEFEIGLPARHQGQSAIHFARAYREQKRNLWGSISGVREYCVSTRGRDETDAREYIVSLRQACMTYPDPSC